MDFSNVKAIRIPEGAVTKIADASGRVLWKKAASGEPFTFIDSLVVPAGATLDTGISCASTDLLWVSFAPMAASMTGHIVNAGTSRLVGFEISGSTLKSNLGKYSKNLLTISSGVRHTVYVVDNDVYVDDGYFAYYTGVRTFTADTPIKIGGVSGKIQLWGVKHGTNASNVDFHAVPAIRNSDQTAGLYDQVGKKFYPYSSAN